jgi:hypothetical protein
VPAPERQPRHAYAAHPHPLLLISLVRIMVVYDRRLEVHADQAAFTHLQNGQPIHMADVQ